MKTPTLALTAAVSLFAALHPLGAQSLPEGEWSGTLSWCCARPGRPGVAPVAHRLHAIYYVTMRGEAIGATGRFTSPHTGDGLALALHDLKVVGDTLTFRVSGEGFPTDEQVACALRRRDDGAFEGPCNGTETNRTDNLRMLMVPPEQN